MFEKDYRLYGKHATYAKFMKDDAGIFNYIIDVYMNGAIWGLMNNRTAPRDRDSKDDVNILASQFSERRDKCMFLYRLVMLLDETTDLTPQERIDRAFRDDAEEESPEKEEKLKANLEVFHSYVRGGIEKLYEDFIADCTTKDDYMNRVHEMVTNFSDTLPGVDLDSKLSKLLG